MRYDRGRQSLDRHATYIVATFVAGAARSFHPTDAGPRELARLVTCYLVANPTRPEDDVVGAVPIGAIGNPVPECLRSAS
jgi:hypothetical protein